LLLRQKSEFLRQKSEFLDKSKKCKANVEIKNEIKRNGVGDTPTGKEGEYKKELTQFN
jgi:hypothetical protein